ncbi:hypothetical protein IGI53_002089 [Enterococcus sp. DIV0788_1]
MNKSLYGRHIHVRLHELALSAISQTIAKFEQHQVETVNVKIKTLCFSVIYQKFGLIAQLTPN